MVGRFGELLSTAEVLYEGFGLVRRAAFSARHRVLRAPVRDDSFENLHDICLPARDTVV